MITKNDPSLHWFDSQMLTSSLSSGITKKVLKSRPNNEEFAQLKMDMPIPPGLFFLCFDDVSKYVVPYVEDLLPMGPSVLAKCIRRAYKIQHKNNELVC